MLSQTGKIESEGHDDYDFSESKLSKEVPESNEEQSKSIESSIPDSAEDSGAQTGNAGSSHLESKAVEDSEIQCSISSTVSKDATSETDVSNLLPAMSGILQVESAGLKQADAGSAAISGAASSTSIQDIKKRIPGLVPLTLPTPPETPGYNLANDICNQNDVPSSESDSSEASPPAMQPLLRRISLPAHGRLKTRLQDPPPLTPAVQSQLTHCSSSLRRRRASLTLSSLDEQQNKKIASESVNKGSSEGVQTNVVQPPTSLAEDSSNLKARANVPASFDEDHDPLDDDIIPASKKRKTKETKWMIFSQWFGLFLLVAFLACSMKIASLRKAKFLGLDLWRWEALTLVILCGRLISEWIVKLLVMLIEKQYILKKRVLYFVYGLRRSVKNSIWLALVLGVWEGMFQGLEGNTAVYILTKTVSVWTLKRLMKLIRKTNITTYSSILSQEEEDREISSEVQAKAAAKQVLALVLFIVFFLIFGVETSKLLVFFSSVFLPSVFIFGNTARTTFESLIFLFVTHPFDVGDRIVVDGQNMLVEEMNVANTIFLGPSNEKVYYPNALLSLKAISNYYRSPDQGDAIEFQITMSTPVEKLGMLKERMQRYIESLPHFWYPDFCIVCEKIQDSNKMSMAVWLRHRINFQEGGERYQRKSNMLLYLKQQLEELGIGYQLPRQEVTVIGIPFNNSQLSQ